MTGIEFLCSYLVCHTQLGMFFVALSFTAARVYEFDATWNGVRVFPVLFDRDLNADDIVKVKMAVTAPHFLMVSCSSPFYLNAKVNVLGTEKLFHGTEPGTYVLGVRSNPEVNVTLRAPGNVRLFAGGVNPSAEVCNYGITTVSASHPVRDFVFSGRSPQEFCIFSMAGNLSVSTEAEIDLQHQIRILKPSGTWKTFVGGEIMKDEPAACVALIDKAKVHSEHGGIVVGGADDGLFFGEKYASDFPNPAKPTVNDVFYWTTNGEKKELKSGPYVPGEDPTPTATATKSFTSDGPTSSPGAKSGSKVTGAIVGCVVGALVVVSVTAFVIVWYKRRSVVDEERSRMLIETNLNTNEIPGF